MTICNKKRFKKTQLCRGDLRHRIQIVSRALQPANYNQTEPQELITVLYTVSAGIETLRGTSKFDGVNIDQKATHLFYIIYSSRYENLEHGNNFVKHRGKLYRLLNTTEFNEDRQFFILQCTERGDETLEANQA
jgi:hypothetical protein